MKRLISLIILFFLVCNIGFSQEIKKNPSPKSLKEDSKKIIKDPENVNYTTPDFLDPVIDFDELSKIIKYPESNRIFEDGYVILKVLIDKNGKVKKVIT